MAGDSDVLVGKWKAIMNGQRWGERVIFFSLFVCCYCCCDVMLFCSYAFQFTCICFVAMQFPGPFSLLLPTAILIARLSLACPQTLSFLTQLNLPANTPQLTKTPACLSNIFVILIFFLIFKPSCLQGSCQDTMVLILWLIEWSYDIKEQPQHPCILPWHRSTMHALPWTSWKDMLTFYVYQIQSLCTKLASLYELADL